LIRVADERLYRFKHAQSHAKRPVDSAALAGFPTYAATRGSVAHFPSLRAALPRKSRPIFGGWRRQVLQAGGALAEQVPRTRKAESSLLGDSTQSRTRFHDWNQRLRDHRRPG